MENKWGGYILIASIVLGCSLLIIAVILGSYATYHVNNLPVSPAAATAAGETVIQKGTYEIQVQYYAPGNSVMQFTVSSYVGSYVYSGLGDHRVLTLSSFSYVFDRIPAANQVTMTLVNPNPPLAQLAGLQLTPLVTTPYSVVTSAFGTSGPFYTVSIGVSPSTMIIRFYPAVLASVTTPLTITVTKDIRFVVGTQV